MGEFLRGRVADYCTRAAVRRTAVAGLAAVLAACAQFEREFAIREESPLAKYFAEPVTEGDVARDLERRPASTRPARLALYEIARLDPDEEPTTTRHLDVLVDRLAAERARFTSVTRITPLVLSGPPDLPHLRQAAARSQSDLLLVCELDRRSAARASPIVLLNLLLIGLLLPSETVEVGIRIQALLFDTASGSVVGSYHAAAEGKDHVPTLSVGGAVEDLTARLAAEAYAQLGDRVMVQSGQP